MLQRLAQIGDQLARKQDTDELVLDMAFSSEEPYARWWGIEILDHGEKSIRLGRLNDGAPVLFNHDWDEIRGTHEPGSVHVSADRKLRGTVRLTTATQAGKETSALVQSKILTKASISYQIHRVVEKSTNKAGDPIERELDGALFERILERANHESRGDVRAFRRSLDAVAGPFERSDDKPATYIATDWEPLENSLVTVPADNTVGVGRSRDSTVPFFNPAISAAIKGDTKVSDESNAAAGASADDKSPTNPVEFEKKRKQAIRNLCVAYKLDERYERAWIEEGADMGKVSEDIMKIVAERNSRDESSRAFLDLDKADVRKYSLMRALRAAANNDWKDAGLELECNQEISKRLDRTPKSRAAFFVPLDKMLQSLPNAGRRDMTVAGSSGSQYLVGTDNLPGSFIDLLRNTSVALRMGVTKLSGLKGHVTIPKMTAGNTAYWLADENTQITESQPTIGQLSLSPKNVAAITEVSHQLLSQSTPDAESLLMSSIARDIGLAVDVAVLRGSGSSGQPTGIVNTASIGAFTGTSLAAAGVLDAQADVAAANALFPGCGYVTTPAVAALLMARPELPSTGTERLWKGNMATGSIFDFPAMSSAQMSSATMLFGWWPSVILAEWGVLELMVNPYSDFTRGLSAVRGWYTCDVGVRYAGAWSYASSIT